MLSSASVFPEGTLSENLKLSGDYKDEGGSAVGVTIHNGYLYTSTVTKVLRNKLTPGKLVPESKTEIILTDNSENVVRNWHTTKPLAFRIIRKIIKTL